MYMGKCFVNQGRAAQKQGELLTIWPDTDRVRDFILVLITCKFDEDPIMLTTFLLALKDK